MDTIGVAIAIINPTSVMDETVERLRVEAVKAQEYAE